MDKGSVLFNRGNIEGKSVIVGYCFQAIIDIVTAYPTQRSTYFHISHHRHYISLFQNSIIFSSFFIILIDIFYFMCVLFFKIHSLWTL